MPDDEKRSTFAAVSTNPLADLPIGHSIRSDPVVFGESNAGVVPADVKNWDFFQGALTAIGLRRGDAFEVLGTGVMVAPGLALTATHVLRDDIPALVDGEVGALCIGVRSEAIDLWKIRSVSVTRDDDLAYLSLELASRITDAWRFTSIAITTRCPRGGERLTIVGFRFPEIREASEGRLLVHGDLLAASGTVTAVYPTSRDPVLMPYPTIEIACGSLGGMSGGAVLDASGSLVGVISRGFEFEDGAGPTSAAWVIGAFARQLDIPWPPGLYERPSQVMAIPDLLLRIVGRDAIRVTGPNETEYRAWFDATPPPEDPSHLDEHP